MTSSNLPQRRRRSVLLLWFVALLVLVGIAYTFAWMRLADVVRSRVDGTLAALRATGATADCANHEVRGFPLHFVLECESIRYADPAGLSEISTASMRASADIYDPRRIRIRVAQPALVKAPAVGQLVVHWRKMDGELFPPLGGDAAISIDGKALVAEHAQAEPVVTIASMQGMARAIKKDVYLDGRFEGLEFGPSWPDLQALPPLSGKADVTVADGATLALGDARSFRGHSATIRELMLSPSDDASITVKGRVSVDDEGRLDADLKVHLRSPQELAAALKLAFPEAVKEIDNATAVVAMLGSDPLVPVTIRKGKVTVGFIPLGRIPSLP
jgi:hypothetical protein